MGRDADQAAKYLRPGAKGSELPPPVESPVVLPAGRKGLNAEGLPTALEWAALQIAGKETKAHRGGIAAGKEQAVDFAVRVRGKINVGGAGSSTKREAPTAEALLTTLLTITPEDQRPSMVKRIALAHSTMTADKIPEGVKEAVDNIIALLTTTTTGHRSGSITGAVVVELVERGGKPPRGPRRAA